MASGQNATGYGFNHMEEIKSHSSQLFNERLAILFYLLDMDSVGLYQNNNNVDLIKKVFAFVERIYVNMRTVMRNDPVMRTTLSLETKDTGIYLTDVMIKEISKLIYYADENGYTKRRCYIIVERIKELEMLLRDVLQYYQYFVRSNFRQKPDINVAVEKYKSMVDKMTLDQLQDVVGKKHKIDFDGLGESALEIEESMNNIQRDAVLIDDTENI